MPKDLYEEYTKLLNPIAINLLQDADDAADMVQETILKWLSKEDKDKIENPRGYLVRTLINKCLNYIRDHRKKRSEVEIAPELLKDFLPARIEQQPELSLGVLAMLEKLTSLERAVFLLKEIFSYAHKEIAEMLDISEEYCRQLLSRARRHLKNDRQRFDAKPEQHLQLYRTFVEVCRGADMGELLEILKEDIRIDISRPAAQVKGALHAAEFFLTLPHKHIRYEWMWLKDLPVIVAYLFQQPAWIIRLDGEGAQISRMEIEVIGDPALFPMDFLKFLPKS